MVILLRGELLDALVVSATTHSVHSFVSTLQRVRCRVSPSHYACVNIASLAEKHGMKRKRSFEIRRTAYIIKPIFSDSDASLCLFTRSAHACGRAATS